MSNTEALQRLFTSYGNAMYRNDPDAAEQIAQKFSAALAQPAASGGPVAWIYQNSNTEREYLVGQQGTGGRNWRPLYATAQPAPAPADIAAKLRDPVLVHAAMLRGEIATPAIRDMLHVYGADALARWDNAQPAPARVPQAAWIQRQQPFTGLQIDAILSSVGLHEPAHVLINRDIARAIEAAHGIAAPDAQKGAQP